MNEAHLRPNIAHHSIYGANIPASHAHALERRQALEAQQRSYRETPTGRVNPDAQPRWYVSAGGPPRGPYR